MKYLAIIADPHEGAIFEAMEDYIICDTEQEAKEFFDFFCKQHYYDLDEEYIFTDCYTLYVIPIIDDERNSLYSCI